MQMAFACGDRVMAVACGDVCKWLLLVVMYCVDELMEQAVNIITAAEAVVQALH